MSGEARAPETSAWLQQQGMSRNPNPPSPGLLYGNISFNDANLDEGTMWSNWFWPATAGVTYPELERSIRGVHRGVTTGSY